MVKVEEVDDEGLIALIGENVMLFCLNYIYTGTLVGVNEKCVILDEATIIFETGDLKAKGWKDAERLPGRQWYVQVEAIESFGALKK